MKDTLKPRIKDIILYFTCEKGKRHQEKQINEQNNKSTRKKYMDKEEWYRQADYDVDTAEFMFSGERYFYSVFMCHLSIEKALKGLYIEKFGDAPPKTHILLYLLEIIEMEIPEDMYDFVFTLNRVSVLTRYPADLQKMLEDYDREKTKEILDKSKELLRWLKKK
ncbi:HEPN domain protein [uncultured archaeon]|nr:HEPN domain protein [uncultured archaeon]